MTRTSLSLRAALHRAGCGHTGAQWQAESGFELRSNSDSQEAEVQAQSPARRRSQSVWHCPGRALPGHGDRGRWQHCDVKCARLRRRRRSPTGTVPVTRDLNLRSPGPRAGPRADRRPGCDGPGPSGPAAAKVTGGPAGELGFRGSSSWPPPSAAAELSLSLGWQPEPEAAAAAAGFAGRRRSQSDSNLISDWTVTSHATRGPAPTADRAVRARAPARQRRSRSGELGPGFRGSSSSRVKLAATVRGGRGTQPEPQAGSLSLTPVESV